MKLWNFISRRALPLWVGFNVLILGITIFCGFASDIDPEKMPFSGLALMSFPIWYFLSLLLLILNLFICRSVTPVNAAALIIAIKPFLAFCPIHPFAGNLTDEEKANSFKILSYNTLSFVDYSAPQNPDFNRTMHTILSSKADAVVLLEYENQGRISRFVPQSQLDSLHSIYPYFERGSLGTVMYSKRPVLHIQPPENVHSMGSIEAFRTYIEENPINIFAVHLESIGLNNDDKELYSEITDTKPERANLRALRNNIVKKLYRSFKNRAHQARTLRNYVEYMGGDAVVCGDFNDVPDCRAIKILEEAGLTDVYSALGNGPGISYNDPRFPFRIDHILYKGGMKAVKIERGNVPSSDHYPMLTTFVWLPRNEALE